MMKKRWAIPFILLTGIALCLQEFYFKQGEASQSQEPTDHTALQFTVESRAAMQNLHRFGLNLGGWNTWGAEEFAHNILFNPGMEGKIDRMLVIVTQSDKEHFSDVKGWGQPDGFWNGAIFEVRTGDHAGFRGTISNSWEAGKDGQPEYLSTDPLPSLKEKDVILLIKKTDPNPLSQWWLPKAPQTLVLADPTQHRPGSSGVQSAVLAPVKNQNAELINFIDHITDRAGKLILVNGPWRLKFWAKAEGDQPLLQIELRRLNQTPAFISESIEPSTQWQEYVFEFDGHDDGAAEILMLKLSSSGQNMKVWIDDAWLGPIQKNNDTAFRQEIVDMIKKMQPSFLRDWQGQLADTMENRIADQYARRVYTGRSAGNAPNEAYAYSIPDFLNLCEEVGANPWIIAPTVLLDREYEEFGHFLAQHASKSRFKEVYVEFGNENWNWIFKPAGLPFPESHGMLAEKAFHHIMNGSSNQANIVKVVNGQYVNPDLSLLFLSHTPSADVLAVAPYYFDSLDTGLPQEEAVEKLFASDDKFMKQISEKVKPLNKKLAVYEVNMHTTQGNAASIERDAYVAGSLSGAALAKHLLEHMREDVQPQMVFSFSQFDTKLQTVNDYVRLWGITRDVSPTKRFRPTGLALEMLNQAIGNTGHRVTLSGTQDSADAASKITATAFSQDSGWSAAIVSSLGTPTDIEITFPDDKIELPRSIITLESKSPFDTNEDSEEVKAAAKPLQTNGRTAHLTVPPFGLVVLIQKKEE